MRFHLFLPAGKGSEQGGRMRRLLGRLGPTWASAPWRRVIQAACLILFALLFFYVCWPYGAQDYAADFAVRRKLPPELFLKLDPLVGLSAAIASRMWIATLVWTGGILALCLFVPRGFCGYICPLGTLIDCCDALVGRRHKRPAARGGWVHLKYYLLGAILVSSALGVLLSGFFAAIPVLTRGLQFTLAPLQMGLAKGFYLVPPMNAGYYLSIALFLATLGLGFFGRRFWCRYLCPTGAIFSLANLLRLTQRQVASTCTRCGKCRAICPYDAIKPDFTTRMADCTFCQTCGGVCPAGAISFVPRPRGGRCEGESPKSPDNTPGVPISRRGLLAAGVGGATYAIGVSRLMARPADPPVRPPGSIPEPQFLQLCIRCGECFKACPNNVLQPAGFRYGPDALWTPVVVANWSGCSPSCSNCGQVCPTGAIRPLPIEEKRAARMGLAIIDQATCLPYAGTGSCQMCLDECTSAGYHAIEFRQVDVQVDADGIPIEGTGRLVPVVLPDLCVGCGLCQTRCHGINVREKKLLGRTAIEVRAGADREDRATRGSFIQMRQQRQAPATRPAETYLPDFVQ
jgi:ferredoxin